MILWLPDAVRDDHGHRLSWSQTSDPKGCLHTTEGGGWPTYSGWTISPHGTVMPRPGRGVDVRQHVPLDSASFSLRNQAGGVQTNRDYVWQWELIGTCDPARRSELYFWPEADDAVLADLARKVIVPLSTAMKIPLRAPTWKAYPSSYGRSNVRMSGPEFDSYSGWLGHEHVPENAHGDPGLFPWGRLLRLAQPPLEDDVPLNDTDISKILDGKIDATYTDEKGDRISLGDAVGLAQRWALHGALRTQALEEQLAALDAKVSALAAAPGAVATVDVALLAASIAHLLPAAPTAEQVADVLAARLQQ